MCHAKFIVSPELDPMNTLRLDVDVFNTGLGLGHWQIQCWRRSQTKINDRLSGQSFWMDLLGWIFVGADFLDGFLDRFSKEFATTSSGRVCDDELGTELRWAFHQNKHCYFGKTKFHLETPLPICSHKKMAALSCFHSIKHWNARHGNGASPLQRKKGGTWFPFSFHGAWEWKRGKPPRHDKAAAWGGNDKEKKEEEE